MEEEKKAVVTTIRFVGTEIDMFQELRIWAIKNNISMAEGIKRAIALLLAQENASGDQLQPAGEGSGAGN